MTLKSRLYATALAIGLSTQAAATTITLPMGYSTFQVLGPSGAGFYVFPTDRGTLLPAPVVLDLTKRDGWEYFVDVIPLAPPLSLSYHGGIIASDCYYTYGFCDREPRSSDLVSRAGDLIRFGFYWGGPSDRPAPPQIQLTFNTPEGVTLSHLPLPASWVLLASALGLGGLFRWAKRRGAVA